MSDTRSIRVEALTRVEGEGGLHIRMAGDVVEDVQLTIYEPPRFFEGFLRGRPLQEVPDITARICGICPVAYQMSAVHALEQALQISITPEIRRLRRLLYCGEWIESHGLHMHLLHAPDFFGADSGIALAARFPQQLQRGLQLKKHGNTLLEVLGGRAIHPVNVAVGGFYRAPNLQALQQLIPAFEWGLQAAIEATHWVAGFEFPEFEQPWEMVALSHPDEYAMNEGTVRSSAGLQVSVSDFETHFEEHHVAHSTALQARRIPNGGSYHVGPLARVNLNYEQLCPEAKRTAEDIGFQLPCQNPFRSIIARGLELIHAYSEGLSILRSYRPYAPARIPWIPRAGSGCAATEAPRGLIYHRYEVDGSGNVVHAKIVPPTSQNQRQIENDLRHWLPLVLDASDQQTADACERLIRSYDPCISCSTHFLKISFERTTTGVVPDLQDDSADAPGGQEELS